MTDIKSAIEELKNADEYCVIPSIKSRKLAIRSLKAWEEVLNELEELKQEFKNDRRIHEAIAVNISIKRINQHLAEIEE